MKAKEIREKSPAELSELLLKLERELLDARFKKATGQLKDTSIISKLRRDIARINTIARERVQ
ncbi:MAG TPA: 50S ribosomal protein L29 [Deltaproteobacteria bacterium]|nr:50S ribosomal protein L29 [Deltaproteobacteria bacterium]HOM29600.1 50S ribosomal protein L29 [Deltaproteobacteria bacterium]HPP81290.1 50S ribosomal protein L29 [Deltaproteobacteria bacterium]